MSKEDFRYHSGEEPMVGDMIINRKTRRGARVTDADTWRFSGDFAYGDTQEDTNYKVIWFIYMSIDAGAKFRRPTRGTPQAFVLDHRTESKEGTA